MDLRLSLASIAALTLVIAGAGDRATPPWHGSQIASAIGGGRLSGDPGGVHLANVSQPGEVTAHPMAHLTSPAAAGRPG